MSDSRLTPEQRSQEEEYYFPYHYLDLMPYREHSLRIAASYRRIVSEMLRPFEGQRVLDAGCGDGRFCWDLRNENIVLTGVDYSERAIRFAQALVPDVRFERADLREFHPKEPFDAIVMIEVLEHLPPALADAVLMNLSRCIAPKGRLIVTVPTKAVPVSSKHYQHFDVNSLTGTLSPHWIPIEMCGHVRMGRARRKIRRRMLLEPYLGPWCRKLGLVRSYYRKGDRILKSIEKCDPSEGERIIAVCRCVSDGGVHSGTNRQIQTQGVDSGQ